MRGDVLSTALNDDYTSQTSNLEVLIPTALDALPSDAVPDLLHSHALPTSVLRPSHSLRAPYLLAALLRTAPSRFCLAIGASLRQGRGAVVGSAPLDVIGRCVLCLSAHVKSHPIR